MSWSLIYEKKFPEVIARYLLNHFLLEAVSADPSPLFPSPIQMILSFYLFSFMPCFKCVVSAVSLGLYRSLFFWWNSAYRAVLLITLPLALHPQKHGTDVKSSLTLKSLLSFWSSFLLDLLEYLRLCPFIQSSWWLSPEWLVFTDITTEFLCIYHSQSIYLYLTSLDH